MFYIEKFAWLASLQNCPLLALQELIEIIAKPYKFKFV